jgi:aspartate racemase
MKTIGLIGGMSWESTVPYYQVINRQVMEQLGGLHSAKIILYSFDFHEIEHLLHTGEWGKAGQKLADAAYRLQQAGADFIVICTNTMHKVAGTVEGRVSIPLLHIADPTAEAIRAAGHSKVGLLGTRFTMEQPFYRDRLVRNHGIDVVVPSQGDREIVHRIIYEELCKGTVLNGSREEYRRIMRSLADDGAEAIILGCTEISLLVDQSDSPVPVFDTTHIHAQAAARIAIR